MRLPPSPYDVTKVRTKPHVVAAAMTIWHWSQQSNHGITLYLSVKLHLHCHHHMAACTPTDSPPPSTPPTTKGLLERIFNSFRGTKMAPNSSTNGSMMMEVDEDDDNKNDDEDAAVLAPISDSAWTQSFLRDCKRGARQAALALMKACQSNEDCESLRKMSIQIIQELHAGSLPEFPPTDLEEARSMVTPYMATYNAEDHENLFHVWNSLVGQPDPNHPQNQASRSARCLLTPNRADRLLWARQALNNPEIDNGTVNPDRGLLDQDKATLGSSSSPLDWDKRTLSAWIEKWCEPFGIETNEWILLLPANELVVSQINEGSSRETTGNMSLLQQIAEARWGWLLSTLREALQEWRLEAKFPTLVHPVVHKHWKEKSHTTMVIQCVIFLARVRCAMKILERDALESPPLLYKILRCANLLQHEASKVFQEVEIQELRPKQVYAAQSQKNTPRNDENPASGSQSGDPTRATGNNSESQAIAPDIEANTTVNQSEDSPLEESQQLQATIESASDGKTDEIPGQAAPQTLPANEEGDPYALGIRSMVDSRQEFLQNISVEKLHSDTGQVLETFDNGYMALASGSDSKNVTSFEEALLGVRRHGMKFHGHDYKGYFWRVQGSTAVPDIDESDDESDVSEDGVSSPPQANEAADPYALRIRGMVDSRQEFLQNISVEKLHSDTGQVLETFDNGYMALASGSDSKNVTSFEEALLGVRRHGMKFHGHDYKGYFWRVQGSTAVPDIDESDDESDVSEDGVSSPPQANEAADPYALRIRGMVDSRQEFLQNISVEKLHSDTGQVLETFDNGYMALASGSDSKNVTSFEEALLGVRRHGMKFHGHDYKGYFWRVQGSTAKPDIDETDDESHVSEDGGTSPPQTADVAGIKTTFPSNKSGQRTKVAGAETKGSHSRGKGTKSSVASSDGSMCPQEDSSAAALENTSPEKLPVSTTGAADAVNSGVQHGPPSVSTEEKSTGKFAIKTRQKPWDNPAADAFAAGLLKSAGTREKFLSNFPVELLDAKTGRVLGAFANGHLAAKSISEAATSHENVCRAVVGLAKAADGHVYKGFFWRLKGSKVLPGSSVLPSGRSISTPDEMGRDNSSLVALESDSSSEDFATRPTKKMRVAGAPAESQGIEEKRPSDEAPPQAPEGHEEEKSEDEDDFWADV